jgi:hypothetical protein
MTTTTTMGKGGIVKETTEFLKIGAIKVPINRPNNPELVPAGFGKQLVSILIY